MVCSVVEIIAKIFLLSANATEFYILHLTILSYSQFLSIFILFVPYGSFILSHFLNSSIALTIFNDVLFFININ